MEYDDINVLSIRMFLKVLIPATFVFVHIHIYPIRILLLV